MGILRYHGLYSQRFNHIHKQSIKLGDGTGKLFENSARAKIINEDSYLVHLCRYIHLNPVEADLVPSPANWQYSNYLQCINEKDGNIQDQDFINRIL